MTPLANLREVSLRSRDRDSTPFIMGVLLGVLLTSPLTGLLDTPPTATTYLLCQIDCPAAYLTARLPT